MNPLNEEFTKIYFYATAGLRLIPPKEAEILLDYIRMIIEQTVFIFEKANVRIIEGDEEGIALWFAINYLENNLNGSDRTLGVHDLGGGNSSFSFFFFFSFSSIFQASTQICFSSKGNFNENSPIIYRNQKYYLYVFTLSQIFAFSPFQQK